MAEIFVRTKEPSKVASIGEDTMFVKILCFSAIYVEKQHKTSNADGRKQAAYWIVFCVFIIISRVPTSEDERKKKHHEQKTGVATCRGDLIRNSFCA